MSDQLELVPAAARLTDRQQLALTFVAEQQPVASGTLGAYLHELRQLAGGRGHMRAERCDWCTTEGASMGRALRAKRLLKYSRKHVGWITPEFPPLAGRDADANFGTIPF